MSATVQRAARSDLDDAYDLLAARDPDLATLIAAHGRPDPFLWKRLRAAAGDDPLAELTLHIISQQISTAAALSIYARALAVLDGRVDAAGLLAVSPSDLRAAGMSRAKARSLQDVAQRVLDGRLDFKRLARSDDAAAEAELQAVRGVGPWSSQMFLLHHLRRPDVFPATDVGLLRGAQSAFALATRPTPVELAERAERWRPFRSYAAGVLWAHADELAER
jgi:DNA-3-methyladenine glycosylase II